MAHKRIHDTFVAWVQKLEEKLNKNGPSDELASELYITIGEWLMDHVRNEDTRLAAYIRE